MFCFLCHTFSAAPSAGELSNGYLHGGLIVDFIGQGALFYLVFLKTYDSDPKRPSSEGPISKWRLVFIDAAILALQLIMLALVVSKQDQNAAETQSVEQRAISRSQDLDSEEQGEVRRHSLSLESGDSDNAESEGQATDRRRREEESLLMNGEDHVVVNTGEAERNRERRIFELTSGEFMAAELKVVDVVKNQWLKGAVQAAEVAQNENTVVDMRTRRRT